VDYSITAIEIFQGRIQYHAEQNAAYATYPSSHDMIKNALFRLARANKRKSRFGDRTREANHAGIFMAKGYCFSRAIS
jgi:hypothetical protein